MAVALILSGGIGTRIGSDIPKQYIEIYDRPVISYCIEQLLTHKEITAVQIVAAVQWQNLILKCIEKYDCKGKFRGFSKPGKNRQLSIYNGLRDIRKYMGNSDAVMIHDAARPLISAQLITDCLMAMDGHDGVLPVLPMKDAVYESRDGKRVSALLNRDKIFAGQAPEVFKIGAYYEANRCLFPDKIRLINGSTEPAVMAGMDIVMIAGDEENFKITTGEDLMRFWEIMGKRRKGTADEGMGFA